MFNIRNIKIETPSSSKLNPMQLHFTENTTNRKWDLIDDTNDRVEIILFNTSNQKLIALKRFEPAVYVTSILKEDRKSIIDMDKYPETLGVVIGLCGTNLKKVGENFQLQVIKLAISEETGYEVSNDSLEFVSSFKSDVGHKCGVVNLFYCEVNDEMRSADAQRIGEVVMEMEIMEVREYITKSFPCMRSSPIFLFAMLWFFREKYN